MDENLGLDFLGIPGTNGPEPAVRRVAAVRRDRLFARSATPAANDSPYRRRQLAVPVLGQHDLDHGRTHLPLRRRHRPAGDEPLRDRVAAPAASRLAADRRSLSGGASANTYNNFATFLLGLPTSISKSVIPFEDNYTRSRNWQFSLFVKDQWQIRTRADRVARRALGLLPDGHADDARPGALRLTTTTRC